MKYKIVWPALERWLTENKISVNRFGQMLGVSTNTLARDQRQKKIYT